MLCYYPAKGSRSRQVALRDPGLPVPPDREPRARWMQSRIEDCGWTYSSERDPLTNGELAEEIITSKDRMSRMSVRTTESKMKPSIPSVQLVSTPSQSWLCRCLRVGIFAATRHCTHDNLLPVLAGPGHLWSVRTCCFSRPIAVIIFHFPSLFAPLKRCPPLEARHLMGIHTQLYR